jgi:hypothetical protein
VTDTSKQPRGDFHAKPLMRVERKCFGCDFESEQCVLALVGSLHDLLSPNHFNQAKPSAGLFWWLARKEWTGVVGGYKHMPAELILRVRPPNSTHAKSTVLHTGGRLSADLLAQYAEATWRGFADVIGENATRIIDDPDHWVGLFPKQTLVWVPA